MNKFFLIFAFCTVLILVCITAALPAEPAAGLNALPVSLYHPVYLFLDRMDNQGYINFRGSSRPLTRSETLKYLNSIDLEKLSTSEKKLLTRFLQKLNPVYLSNPQNPASNLYRIRNLIWKNSPFYRDGYNLYHYQRENFYAAVDPILYYDFVTDSTGETVTRRTNGINIAASFSDKVGFSFDFRDNLETGRGPYGFDDRDKLYSDHAGYVSLNMQDVVYYDFTRAVIAASRNNLSLQFGRGDFAWGPGHSGHLMLSDNPPPFDFLSLGYHWENLFRFTFIAGKINPYPEVYADIDITEYGWTRRILASKYISAHRLEIYPLKSVELGFAESVIYGERPMEPAYLNPINLYYSAQHNLGDMDNVAWSGDFKFRFMPGIQFFGELFIDDMRTGELGSDYIGNKFAWLTGIYLTNPLKLSNLDLWVEYAHLDPFVYTHFYPINTYKNWNSSLGYWLPPNSDALLVDLTWQPLYTLKTGVSAEIARHGENTDDISAGGDIDTPPYFEQKTAPFLAGKLIYTNLYQFMCCWEPWEDYSLTGRIKWRKFTSGEQWEYQLTFGVNVWER